MPRNQAEHYRGHLYWFIRTRTFTACVCPKYQHAVRSKHWVEVLRLSLRSKQNGKTGISCVSKHSRYVWFWCRSNVLHAPVSPIGFMKYSVKSRVGAGSEHYNIYPNSAAGLSLCSWSLWWFCRQAGSKCGFTPLLESRREFALFSRWGLYPVLYPERTNVLLGGTLPVWIPMKGLAPLDLGPANGWFNTLVFYHLSWQLMF